MFTISNHRLAGVPFVATPNQGGRIEPTMIVLHDTAGRLDKGNSVSWFQNKTAKVSAHLVVERDGSVTQLVAFDRAAWHAGTSSWKGRKSCNGFSIGIEIVSPGKLIKRGAEAVAWFGECWPLTQCTEVSTKAHGQGWWLRYTDAQLESVRDLVRAIAAAYPTITDVAAHWEISPGRKVDCGPNFPLADCKALLAARQPLPRDLVEEAQTRLAELGYWPGPVDGAIGPKTRSAVRDFQEQNGLAILNGLHRADGGLDEVTLRVLFSEQAQRMPAGGAEELTPRDLAKAGSGQVKDAAMLKRIAEGTALSLLSNAAVEASVSSPAPDVAAAINAAGKAVEIAEQARGLGIRVVALIDWAMTPRGLFTVAAIFACGAIWWLGHRIAWRRTAEAQQGRNVGR